MYTRRVIKTYRSLAFMAAATLLSLAGIIFVVVPAGQKSVALWEEEAQLRKDIAAYNAKLAVLDSLDETTLKNNLTALVSAVPAEKSIGTILATLDGVSGINVLIEDFALAKPGSIGTESAKRQTADESKIGSNILPFSITVSGDAPAIRTFMSAVTRVRRLFRIQALDVSYTTARPQARVNLEAFYHAYPAAIGAVGAPISQLSDHEESVIASMSAFPLEFSLTPASVASVSSGGKSDPFGI